MFFETSFSSFFVFLATENDVKIELFSLLFRKRRFCENHHETLAVRTKIKVRIWKKHKKSEKNRCRNHDRKKHGIKHRKNRFWAPFWLPKSSQNPPKIEKSRFRRWAEKTRHGPQRTSPATHCAPPRKSSPRGLLKVIHLPKYLISTPSFIHHWMNEWRSTNQILR